MINKHFKNSAHPVLGLFPRTLTKIEYKQLNQAWRVLDDAERINNFTWCEWSILRFIEVDKNSVNSLLLKSFETAINIECYELKEAA